MMKALQIFFLRVYEIINSMRNLGDKINDATIVENLLRSVTPNFNSEVFVIEEMQDSKSLIVEQLHGILIAFEMRKGDPS